MALASCLLLTGCGVKDKLDALLGKGQTETETEAPVVMTEAATELVESETDPPQPHEIDYGKKDLETAPVGIVNQGNVNFRVRPASNTATKTKLKKGEELRLLARVKDEDNYTWWYAERVSMKGVRGYVGAELVDIQEGTYQLKDFDEDALTGVILEDKVNVRKQADVESDRVTGLKKGETVALIEKEYTDDHTWWHVMLKNGKEGYVVSEYIRVQGEPDTEALSTDSSSSNPKAFVSGDYVNLREEASTQSNILKKLLKGARVEVLSQKEGTDYLWLRVRTEDGTVGYVAANYMTFEGDGQ